MGETGAGGATFTDHEGHEMSLKEAGDMLHKRVVGNQAEQTRLEDQRRFRTFRRGKSKAMWAYGEKQIMFPNGLTEKQVLGSIASYEKPIALRVLIARLNLAKNNAEYAKVKGKVRTQLNLMAENNSKLNISLFKGKNTWAKGVVAIWIGNKKIPKQWLEDAALEARKVSEAGKHYKHQEQTNGKDEAVKQAESNLVQFPKSGKQVDPEVVAVLGKIADTATAFIRLVEKLVG